MIVLRKGEVWMLKTLEDVQRFMDRERLASFVTIAFHNEPHVVPVFFTYKDGRVYVQTSRTSAKVRNLTRNDRVALAVYRDEEAVVINGRARVVEDEGEFTRQTQDHVNKYKLRLNPEGKDSMGIPLFDMSMRCIVEIKTEKVRFW
jgi:nitroimidazol reductase NimA-like FMN-containing flavoprotein (pyridoxamine 5'-phosphate oxidase superfamily)